MSTFLKIPILKRGNVDEPVSEDPKTEKGEYVDNVLQKEELSIIGEENFIQSLNCAASLQK
jgi:hypothetical protein